MKIKVNEAQHILVSCGADPQTVLLGHRSQQNPHHTKRGPGRKSRHQRNPAGAKLAAKVADQRLGVRNPGGIVFIAFNEIRKQRSGLAA